MLLLRYYINLGEDENVDISWSDYDTKNKKLILEDEKKPFKPIIPVPNLAKSITQIFIRGKKVITFTLYYTTFNCLVQGNTTHSWVDKEFKTLSEKVKDMSKRKKEDVDQIINSMSMENLLDHNVTVEKDTHTQNIEKGTIPEENPSENKTTQNDSTYSLPDDDIVHALHNIETHNIDQSLSVQNGLKSVQTSSDQILELLKTLNSRMEKIEKAVVSPQLPDIENRLKRLEEKADFMCSKSNTENNEERMKKIESKIDSIHNIQSDKTPDCVKFVESIIELTSKISTIEHNFEKFEYKMLSNKVEKNEIKEPQKDEKKTDSIIETSNKYEVLQDLEEESTGKDEKNQEAPIHTLSEKLFSDFNSETETADRQIFSDQKVLHKINQHMEKTKEADNLTDLWIIGSSVTRNINPKLMYRKKRVRVTILKYDSH